jgi:hypothetical protein
MKSFYDNSNIIGSNKGLFVYQKNDKGKKFRKKSAKSICFEINRDSLNLFDQDKNECWKKTIKYYEDNWGKTLEYIEKNGIDDEGVKKYLSTYFSILGCNSPYRDCINNKIGLEMIKLSLPFAIKKMEAKGVKTPDAIQNKIKNNRIEDSLEIDKDVIRLFGLKSIEKIKDNFLKSPWMLLSNATKVNFLTNDCPVMHYYYNSRSTPIITIPVSPKIIILIHTSYLLSEDKEFPKNCNKWGVSCGIIEDNEKGKDFINNINLNTIKSAKKYIISDSDNEEVRNAISDHL